MEQSPLLQLIRRLEPPEPPDREDDLLVLPYALRQKSRLRVRLESGREAALLLPRGVTLRGGDRLMAETGHVIRVVAAEEPLSVVACADRLLLLRIAYHLGNRHVSVQIDPERITYLHDHVLDDMVGRLGIEPQQTRGPFEPEEGAYHSRHGHDH